MAYVVSPRRHFEFVLFFLFQPNFDVEKSEVERSLLPIDTVSSQAPGVPSEPESPDHCAEHLSRIADLDGRVSLLKHQTMTTMDQVKKSAALSKKVSSLEDQMSVLMAKVVQLEECDLYMTEIIEAASEQLQCKSLGSPRVFLSQFLFVLALLSCPRYLLGSCCGGSSSI
jgi:hypothetical protein